MRKIFFRTLLTIAILCTSSLEAQKRPKNMENQQPNSLAENPKLVVGIIVDQMRYDYLTRFESHFGEGGFKRLINEGFNCKNNHFNYAQTSTAPGHASVYTGTTPSVHGIIGNNWYDKVSGSMVYCVADSTYESKGTLTGAGQMSPHRLNVTTITDQLRLHHQMRSKVIAISLKDRGAVLPGGHTANAAYWFQGHDEGKWVSSSYYMEKLPDWVVAFNESGKVDSYKKPWNTLKSIELYKESGPDSNRYEHLWEGEQAPIFPHDIPGLWEENDQYELIKYSPYGNSIITDFALEALEQERLGTDGITDFLSVSYSSTDLVGHEYGVNSKEIQDIYLRLDLELERLLKTLDKQVGQGEYTVFLTADHGAMHVSAYLEDKKLPGGNISRDDFTPSLEEFLKYRFGTTDILKYHSYSQLFLDHEVIANLDMNPREVQELIALEILSYKGVEQVYTAFQLQHSSYMTGIPRLLQNGYNQKRSGDIFYILESGITDSPIGSSHGSPFAYDTQVPLIFYGKGIRKGSTLRKTEITDIAPTIAGLLGIAFPSGTTSDPVTEVLK